MRDEVIRFVSESLDLWKGDSGRALDVGSLDVNGTVRPEFEKRGWKYVGFDAQPGKNVDVVGDDSEILMKFSVIEPFDCVISCETLEHLKYMPMAVNDMLALLKPGGLFILTAAGNGFPEHRHPVDCWRIMPDGMNHLLRGLSDITVIETPGVWAKGIMGRGWKIA